LKLVDVLITAEWERAIEEYLDCVGVRVRVVVVLSDDGDGGGSLTVTIEEVRVLEGEGISGGD
jgi:hypothetical protein